MITENQNVEWKESWRDEYIKWICGFSNAQGGILSLAHPSKPNNPDVANAFFRAGMIESWGRGIDKIIGQCTLAGLPQPIFDISFGGLQIEFVLAPGNAKIETSGKTSGEIIQLLILNSDITIPEMAEQIGISERSIQRNLQKLQKDHKIERIGPDKGGYWSVNK